MSEAVPDVSSLRSALAGEVVTREDHGWEAARQAWILTADQRPPLVVFAESVDDIAATVRFAAANGLRVAPQSTGHGATSMGSLAGTVLLRTSRMTGVEVDPGARTATVAPGALWSDVVTTAAAHGLVGLHGMSGGVGVAGYTLGGGIGWLARRHGFAASHVRSFDVVDARGERRRVDAASDPDLFWALRGGGGRPLVVTSLELELFELRQAYAGALMWPLERAPDVVPAYREWIATIPDELTSTIKLLRFPPLPTVAAPLRGRSLVAVTLVFCGEQEAGEALLAPLRALGAPYLDTLATIPAAELGELAGDPTDPVPALGHAALVDRVDEEAAAAFLECAGPGVRTPIASLEIRHLGGALRRADPDPGACGPLESEGLVYAATAAPNPAAGEAARAALAEVAAAFAPFSGPRDTLLTFDENRPFAAAFAPETAARLAAVARAHDPDGLFVANHVDD